MAARRPKSNNRIGKICVTFIVSVFMIVMAVQMANLYQKNLDYDKQEAELREQLEEATEEQKELEDYEAYTQTQEYIEDVAKSKLGLAYENETVFKEE